MNRLRKAGVRADLPLELLAEGRRVGSDYVNPVSCKLSTRSRSRAVPS